MKIAVHTPTKAEEARYLKAVEKYTKWKWWSDKKPTEGGYWSDEEKETCINFRDIFTYSSREHYKKQGCKIISVDEAIKRLKAVKKPTKKKPVQSFKVGDHYPDWEKLEALPMRIAKNQKPPLKVGELFVILDTNLDGDPNGNIIKFTEDDQSECPNFESKINRKWYYDLSRLARLPKGATQKEVQLGKTKPVQIESIKYSDGIIHEKASITFPDIGKKTLEEVHELTKQLRRAEARHKKLNF